MDEQIRMRLDDTRRILFEHFDEDVTQRLRLRLADAQAQLDRVGQRFWALTRYILAAQAYFDDTTLAFDLTQPPRDDIPSRSLPPHLQSTATRQRHKQRRAKPFSIPALASFGAVRAR